MSQHELDEAVAQILAEQIDEQVAKAAARRVFSKLFDSAFIGDVPPERIRGCRDMQSLMTDYRSGTLSKSRTMLLEDHILGCADCRRVLHAQKSANGPVEVMQPRRLRSHSSYLAFGLAATLAIGIAIGVTGVVRGIFPWQHSQEATVEAVQGSLYRVSEVGASLIEVGSIIRNSDELRTAKGSSAILRLVGGGARFELGERSDVTMAATWRGTEVNLERGRMIVQGSDTPQHTFYVASGDMIIPIHSTVLALNHGSKGSRVSVAKGSAEVESGRLRNTLLAGQQYSTSYALYNIPIASEFAWSQNASQYQALLNELSSLQKSFQAIPAPGLRYSSKLAQYLPANTIAYAAVPNLGPTLTQAKQIFDSRLAESQVLRTWWQQQPISQNGQFDRVLDQINSVSSYLGSEIVIAMTSNGDLNAAQPVILAEIRQPGLADYVKNNLPADSGVQILNTQSAPVATKDQLFIELDNNVLVASPNGAQVSQIESFVQTPSGGGFTTTPLFARVNDVYSNGADYFLAADLEQIVRKSVTVAKGPVPSGLENVQFLVLERKNNGATTEMRAALSFDGARQGVASWLAAPSPAGSLDFVSPDASLAMSFVMKNPRAVVQEMIGYGSNADAGFAQHLLDFEEQSGVNLLDDVAAPLGSDATFAIDGPGLPTASWKLAIEVNDPEHLKQTLATVVDRFNHQPPSSNMGTLQITSHQAGDQIIYALTSSKAPGLSVSYTFVDGYLLIGANEGNLLATIQNKRTGQKLAASAAFRSKLPADGYTNFSALLYHNIGDTLAPLAQQMKDSTSLTAQQRQSLSTLLTTSGPGVVCIYGDPSRIIAASTGSFPGFDLGALAGIELGKPVIPLIAANAGLARPPAMKSN